MIVLRTKSEYSKRFKQGRNTKITYMLKINKSVIKGFKNSAFSQEKS